MANGHYEQRRVWHQVSASGSGYWVMERVWVPDTAVDKEKNAEKRALANAQRKAAEMAARRAAQEAAKLAKKRAQVSVQKRTDARLAQERTDAAAEYKRHIAEQRHKAVLSLSQKQALRNRQLGIIREKSPKDQVRPGWSRTADAETRMAAAWSRRQPVKDDATQVEKQAGQLWKNPWQRPTVAGWKGQIESKKAAMQIATPADAKRAESMIAGSAGTAATDGGKLTPEQVEALQKAYEQYAGTVAEKIKQMTATLDALSKISGNEALSMGRRKRAYEKYKALYAEYDALFKGEFSRMFGRYDKDGKLKAPGSYTAFYESIDRRALAQREWWKSQVRAQLQSQKQQMTGVRSAALRTPEYAEGVQYLDEQQRIFNEDPTALGQTIDHHEQRLNPETGKIETVPVYRTKTIEEALEDQQAKMILEQQRLWAEYERDRITRMSDEYQMRFSGYEQSPTGEWVKSSEAALSRVAMAYAERVWGKTEETVDGETTSKVNVPEVKRPEDAQKAVDAIMAEWEKDHPEPTSSNAVYSDKKVGGLPTLASQPQSVWQHERDAFENQMYQWLGQPGSPFVLERFSTIPGISHGLAALGVPVGLIGAGYRMWSSYLSGGATTKVGGNLFNLAELPSNQKAVLDAKAKAFYASIGAGGAGMAGVYDPTEDLEAWFKTPEGAKWRDEQSTAMKQKGMEELQSFYDVFYGGKAKDPGEWADAVNLFGSEPTDVPTNNLLFQLLVDPTNAVPLTFLKYGARAAFARKAMAGFDGSRGARWYRGYKSFLEVDHGVLAMEKKMGKYKKALAEKGFTVEEAAEEMRQILLGAKTESELAERFNAFAQKFGISPRDINPAEIQNLAEWVASDIAKKDKRVSLLDQKKALDRKMGEQKRQWVRDSKEREAAQRAEMRKAAERKAAHEAEMRETVGRLRTDRSEEAARMARGVENAQKNADVSSRSNTERARAARARAARASKARPKKTAPPWKRATKAPVHPRPAASAAKPADAAKTSGSKPVDIVHEASNASMSRVAAAAPAAPAAAPAARRVYVPPRPGREYAAHEGWMARFELLEGEYWPRRFESRDTTQYDPAAHPITRKIQAIKRNSKRKTRKNKSAIERIRESPEFKELQERIRSGDETARPEWRAMAERARNEWFAELEDMELGRQGVRGVPDVSVAAHRAGVLGDEEAEEVLIHNYNEVAYMSRVAGRAEAREGVLPTFIVDDETGRIIRNQELTGEENVDGLLLGEDVLVAQQGYRQARDLYEPFSAVNAGFLQEISGVLAPLVSLILRNEFIMSSAPHAKVRNVRGFLFSRTLRSFKKGSMWRKVGKGDPLYADLMARNVPLMEANARVAEIKQSYVSARAAAAKALDVHRGKVERLRRELREAESAGIPKKDVEALGEEDASKKFTKDIFDRRARLENEKFALANEEKAFDAAYTSDVIPGLREAEEAAEQAGEAARKGKYKYNPADDTFDVEEQFPTGAEGWRDLGQITFEVFHRLRTSNARGAALQLRAISNDITNALNGGETDNIFFWQWKLMEIRAGVTWADYALSDFILGEFKRVAKDEGLIPDLAVASIPNGYRPQRFPKWHGMSPMLRDLERSDGFLPAPAEWAVKGPSHVLDEITKIFLNRGNTDAMQIVHYVGQTVGTLRSGFAFRKRLFGELGAMARDAVRLASPETGVRDLARMLVSKKHINFNDEAARGSLLPSNSEMRSYVRADPERVLTPEQLKAYKYEERVTAGSDDLKTPSRGPSRPMHALVETKRAEAEAAYLLRWQRRRYNQYARELKAAGVPEADIPAFADSSFAKTTMDDFAMTPDEMALADRLYAESVLEDMFNRPPEVDPNIRVPEGQQPSYLRPSFDTYVMDALARAYWAGDLPKIDNPRVHELMYLMRMQGADRRDALLGPVTYFTKVMTEIGFRDRAIDLVRTAHRTRIETSNALEIDRIRKTSYFDPVRDPYTGKIDEAASAEQAVWKELGLGADIEKVRVAERQQDKIRAESAVREKHDAEEIERTATSRDKSGDGAIGETMAMTLDQTIDSLMDVEFITEKNFGSVGARIARVVQRFVDLSTTETSIGLVKKKVLDPAEAAAGEVDHYESRKSVREAGGQRHTLSDENRLYEVIDHIRSIEGGERVMAAVRETIGQSWIEIANDTGVEILAHRQAALGLEIFMHSKPMTLRRASSAAENGIEEVPFYSFAHIKSMEPLPGHEAAHADLMRQYDALEAGRSRRDPTLTQQADATKRAKQRDSELMAEKARRDFEYEQGRPRNSIMADVPDAWKEDPSFVYVGRAGKGQDGYFGNPFKVGGVSPSTGRKYENDGDTLVDYANWLDHRIATDPAFAKRVKELSGKHLVCPQPKRGPCHAEILSQRSYWLNHPEYRPVVMEVDESGALVSKGPAGQSTMFFEEPKVDPTDHSKFTKRRRDTLTDEQFVDSVVPVARRVYALATYERLAELLEDFRAGRWSDVRRSGVYSADEIADLEEFFPLLDGVVDDLPDPRAHTRGGALAPSRLARTVVPEVETLVRDLRSDRLERLAEWENEASLAAEEAAKQAAAAAPPPAAVLPPKVSPDRADVEAALAWKPADDAVDDASSEFGFGSASRPAPEIELSSNPRVRELQETYANFKPGQGGDYVPEDGDVIYHGSREGDLETFVDDAGNLHLRHSTNFGTVKSVSFTLDLETALDYAGRTRRGGERAHGGRIFKISPSAFVHGSLRWEAGEEVATSGALDVVIPAGKWKSKLADPEHMAAQEARKAKLQSDVAKMSDEELVGRDLDNTEYAEMAENDLRWEDPGDAEQWNAIEAQVLHAELVRRLRLPGGVQHMAEVHVRVGKETNAHFASSRVEDAVSQFESMLERVAKSEAENRSYRPKTPAALAAPKVEAPPPPAAAAPKQTVGARIRSKMPRPDAKGWAYDKDMRKADRATKFIGRGADGTSTDRYARAYGGSDTVFTADDVVFVSANGGHARPGFGPGHRVHVLGDGDQIIYPEYRAIDTAIEARASFVIDDAANRAREYNTGERQVADYLRSHGYVEVGGSGLFKPGPSLSPAAAAPPPAAAAPPPAAAAPPPAAAAPPPAAAAPPPKPADDPDYWGDRAHRAVSMTHEEIVDFTHLYHGAAGPDYVTLYAASTDAEGLLAAGRFDPSVGTGLGRLKNESEGTIFLTPEPRTALGYAEMYAATKRQAAKLGRSSEFPAPDIDIVEVRVARGTGVAEGVEVRIPRGENTPANLRIVGRYRDKYAPKTETPPAAAPPPPAAAPPPPKAEIPEAELPFEPADPWLIERLARMQNLFKRVTGMTDKEWMEYALRESQKVVFNRKAAESQKAIHRRRIADIRRVQDYMKWHSMYGTTAEVKAKMRRADGFAKAYRERAIGYFPDKGVAPFARSFYDAGVEQVRTYVGFLRIAKIDAAGVRSMDKAGLVDYMPIDVYERAEAEVRAARVRFMNGRHARTHTRVKQERKAGMDGGEPKRLQKAPSHPDKDPRWLAIKAQILAKYDITVPAYDEARFVLNGGHAKRLTAERLILAANKEAAAAVAAGKFKTHEEAFFEAFTRMRHAESERDAFEHLKTIMLHEGAGLSDEQVYLMFVRRYALDHTLRDENVKLSAFQYKTLQEAIKAKSGSEVGTPGLQSFLQSANMPPFDKGHFKVAEFQKKIGAWAPRYYEDFISGEQSWNIDEEASFWHDFFGVTPPWCDRALLAGERNFIFHDAGAYQLSMKQWGVFNRDPQNKALLNGVYTRHELELASAGGDESLGISARRDLAQQRKYAYDRYGDLVGKKGPDGEIELTALPWLMNPAEKAKYMARQGVDGMPRDLIQNVSELDEVVEMLGNIIGPAIERRIAAKRAAGMAVGPGHVVELDHTDIFEISSEAMRLLLADPVWSKQWKTRIKMDPTDFIDMLTKYQRWMVLSNPSFAAMNIVDSPVKMAMHRTFRPGLYGGPPPTAEERALIDAMQPIHLRLSDQTSLFTERQRALRDYWKNPRAKIRVGAFEITNSPVIRIIEGIEGTAHAVPAAASWAEVRAKMDMARRMFPQVYRYALKELGDPELARLWTYNFLGDEISRMWPTAGDHPLERFFNRIVPFASYMVRNKVLFVSEAINNPWIINKINFIGAALEEWNREQWAKENPDDPFPEEKARWLRLPWTSGKNSIWIDFASTTDASRGWQPIFGAGRSRPLHSWISDWVRLVNPGMQAQVTWLTNTLGVTTRTMWKPVYNEDGYPTGTYEKVITGWSEPWSSNLPGPGSGWWFIEGVDQIAKSMEGTLTEGEIYEIIGAALMYNGIEAYDRGSALMGAYRLMMDKDKKAAQAWLENTPNGAYLQEWMREKQVSALRPVKNSFADIQRALAQADSKDWFALSKQDRDAIVEGRAKITRIRELYAYRVSAAKDLDDRRRLKAQMYYEINRVYLSNPALMKDEVWSKSPKEWNTQAVEWQVDRLTDGYVRLTDDRPKPGDYKTRAEYTKAVNDWETSQAIYLKLFPQVEKRLAGNILALEKVREEKEAEWEAIFDRIAERDGQIDAVKALLDDYDPASKKAVSAQMRLDALYLQNEMDYNLLNIDHAATYFTPEDFEQLPYRKTGQVFGPPALRDGITIPRATVLPDWYGTRFKKAQREGRLDEFYAGQKYGADMADAISYARGGDKFGDFSPARWYTYLSQHPEFRQKYFDNNPGKEQEWADNIFYVDGMKKAVEFAGGTWGKKKGKDDGFDPGKWVAWMKRHPKMLKMYFDKNPGKQEEWAKNDEYIRRISVWGKLAQAGKWDRAKEVWDALPQWVKDRYHKNNKTAKRRYAQNTEYLGYMKQWVSFYEKGDSKGAVKFWNSLPKWVRDRYYENHPDKRIEWETSAKMAAKLAAYFAAEDATERSRYLKANPDLARWLGQNTSGADSQRWAIMLAYQSIPKEDEWLRRVFREKYPEIFSQEAIADRKLKAVWAKLKKHPQMSQGFEEWLNSFNDQYLELLKHQPRPVSLYFEPDYERVARKRRHRSLSAAKTSA